MPGDRRANLGTGKKIAFWAILLIPTLLLPEAGLRLILAFRVGPSVLAYGTRLERRAVAAGTEVPADGRAKREAAPPEEKQEQTVEQHDNAQDGYSKYFPNQVRFDHDRETGESFRVTINSRGFRGEEFALEKPRNVVRVVTLGASSTFGYYVRDDQTYPAQLEGILNQSCGDRSFEVINLGVPHLNSDNIRALFLAEALPLAPDVVTFYEGVNDTLLVLDAMRKAEKAHRRFFRWPRRKIRQLGRWLVSAALADSLLEQGEREFREEVFETEARRASQRFVDNVAAIVRECRERGIVPVVGKQQAGSRMLDLDRIKGVTYAEEVALVRQKAAESGELDWKELSFLAHAVLVDQLEAWARASGVPFADVVEALDNDRDVLLSWVHLSPRGNRMVAEVFAREIRARACPARDAL